MLGAGPAGYVCAIRLAQLGKKVTVVERGELGGVCLNVGCIPSKALIYAGTMFERLSHLSEMGIEVPAGAKLDLPKLVRWKEGVVKKLTGGVGSLLKANGCTVIKGEAKFISPKALEIRSGAETIQLSFSQLVIATGSRPAALKGFEIDQKKIVDSTGALALTQVPKTMLCIGGGYIGLELGTFYAKVGTEVTVVEPTSGILGSVDPDLTKVAQKHMEKLGMKIRTKTSVKGCKAAGKGVDVSIQPEGGAEKTENFDVVLVTVGRIPNSDSLGLDKAGLKPDAKGFLTVDGQRRTGVPHIYAIGDIAGQPLLAHKGSKEGMIAAEAIAGRKTTFDVVAIPAVVFTDPEIATVGLTEVEARAKGLTPQVGVFPFAANGRALSVNEPDGFVKMIGDGKTGRLLGVHIVGAEASNLISEAALALEMGAHVEDLALTVHPHPTLPETMMEAAEATMGHAIHIFQRKAAPTESQAQAKVTLIECSFTRLPGADAVRGRASAAASPGRAARGGRDRGHGPFSRARAGDHGRAGAAVQRDPGAPAHAPARGASAGDPLRRIRAGRGPDLSRSRAAHGLSDLRARRPGLRAPARRRRLYPAAGNPGDRRAGRLGARGRRARKRDRGVGGREEARLNRYRGPALGDVSRPGAELRERACAFPPDLALRA